MTRLEGAGRAWRKVLPVFVFVLAAAAFVSTLAPGVLGGDAGELQFVPAILSLTHPTGYPLQTLLDHLWVSLLPWGTVAWRTNLLSALVAAGGLALLALTAQRSTGSSIAVLASVVALLVASVYWGQAVLGDKYALNGLLAALLLLCANRLYRRPEEPASWWALGLAYGLSLAHHRSFLLIAPLLALLALGRGWRMLRRPKTWLAILAFAAPLLLYFYLPWASARNLPPPHPRIADWGSFAEFLSDRAFAVQIGWLPRPENLRQFGQTLLANFHPLLLGLGAVGCILRLRERVARLWLGFLLAAFLLQAYFAQNYTVPRQFVFYIPAYVCLALLLAEAARGWLNLSRGWGRVASDLRWTFGAFAAVLMLGAPLVQLPLRWSAEWREQRVEAPLDIWRQDLKTGGQGDRLAAGLRLAPPRSLVAGDWEQATPLWYAQQVDGACSDCAIEKGFLSDMEQYKARAAQEGRPLLIARTLNGAADWSEPTALGPLVALERTPATVLPPALVPLDLLFDNRLRLAGYAWPLGRPEFRRGAVLPLTLVWQAVAAPLPDYGLSLRLFRGEEQVWATDVGAPVLGMHPFGRLETGQVIGDYYEIPLPGDAASGEYSVRLVLYSPGEGALQNAAVTGADAEGEMAAVLRLTLK